MRYYSPSLNFKSLRSARELNKDFVKGFFLDFIGLSSSATISIYLDFCVYKFMLTKTEPLRTK